MNNQPTPERLPAFLRRAADGQLELVLHCTWIEDWSTCQEKFRLGYNERVSPSMDKVQLNYGKAIHIGQAIRYRWEMEHGSDAPDFKTIEAAQAEAIQKHFEDHPSPDDDYRNAGRAMGHLRAYNKEYPRHDWKVLAVEEHFEVEVGRVPMQGSAVVDGAQWSGTQFIRALLAGRKDLVVSWADGLWVNDFKTTKDWSPDLSSNRNLLMGGMSFQFRGYPWAERARQFEVQTTSSTGFTAEQCPRVFMPVLGVNAIYMCSRPPLVREPKPGAKSAPRDQFHIECYPIEQPELDEWKRDFLLKCKNILRTWQTGEWERAYGKSCGGFGRCLYYDYCKESPERREDLLNSSMFMEKDFSHIGGEQ